MSGLFVPQNIRTTGGAIRTTDDLYCGLFVPYRNILNATKANVYIYGSVSVFILCTCIALVLVL